MLLIVRHGQTAHNAQGRLLGRLDPPLNDVGAAQAAAIGRACVGAARVVASPLRRTRETAEAIAAGLGVPVELDERWIELDYGEFDGTPLADVPADLWARWRKDPSLMLPGGESLADVERRVAAACDELAPHAVDGEVVVVTHVSPIKAAVAWALGVGPEVAWRMFVDQASITRLAMTDRGPLLRSFNETHHLV